jgi:hypothetical protein
MAGRFTTALGARQGSPAAQTQRDREEVLARARLEAELEAGRDAAREAARAAFRKEVGCDLVLDTLVSGYENPAHTTQACHGLLGGHDTTSLDMARACALGDPDGWPGLTAPAVDALGSFLAGTVAGNTTDVVYLCAEYTMQACFTSGRSYSPAAGISADSEYCRRLAPICDGLASIISWWPAGLPLNGRDLILDTADVLRIAPAEAIAGPLQSWVEALAARVRANELTVSELTVLRNIQGERGQDAVFVDAFAPLGS